MLSIVVPVLNEEKYLPLLLESIKKQNFEEELEIIVADSGSKDKTVEIARSQGCKIVKGGKPAKGRNEGAKIAKGELLLFLDADIILPENSLENFIQEFKKRNLDVSGFLLQPWGENRFLKILYNFFYNFPISILEKILPHAAGAILVKKELHKKIGGFDEKIKLAEDHTYVRKAAKFGKFGILKSDKIFYSQRRFERDGWFKTYLKYFLAELHLIFLGPIKSNIFRYNLHETRTRGVSKGILL